MKNPVLGKKLLSKKKTVAYYKKRANKHYYDHIKECLFCGIFASGNVRLRKCAKCHRASYCSRKCQVKHWKAGHKKECIEEQGK